MTAQFALAISFLSFCISAFAFYRGSESAQSKRIKKDKMLLVSARTVLVWEQLRLVALATTEELPLDSYFFPSYQRNIHRLEDALDGAFAVGLFSDLIGTRDNSLPLHAAFLQSLTQMETLDPQKVNIDEWGKQHFTMGMVRLIDQCLRYSSCSIPKKMQADLRHNISPRLNKAWTYLNNDSNGNSD